MIVTIRVQELHTEPESYFWLVICVLLKVAILTLVVHLALISLYLFKYSGFHPYFLKFSQIFIIFYDFQNFAWICIILPRLSEFYPDFIILPKLWEYCQYFQNCNQISPFHQGFPNLFRFSMFHLNLINSSQIFIYCKILRNWLWFYDFFSRFS